MATELAPTAQLVAGAVDVCEGGPRLGLTGSDLRWLLLRQLGHFYRRGHGVSYNAGFPG